MPTSSTDLKAEQLAFLLHQKRWLYNEMIEDNKEFEEVKTLFKEIKTLEQALYEHQQTGKSIFSGDMEKE